jgi:hypothetical protein
MPYVSVPAVYDGKRVRLLEEAPVKGSYRVLVTFVEPTRKGEPSRCDMPRFWDSFGAWRDDRPISETLRDIQEARSSKTEAPALGFSSSTPIRVSAGCAATVRCAAGRQCP